MLGRVNRDDGVASKLVERNYLQTTKQCDAKMSVLKKQRIKNNVTTWPYGLGRAALKTA
jgi:hypothetical protein